MSEEILGHDRRSLQSTLLLEKKREMQEVQVLLDLKRQDFARRMEVCQEKRDDLRAKVSEMS